MVTPCVLRETPDVVTRAEEAELLPAHQTKRRRFLGRDVASRSATSRSTADPLALSLIPGPPRTLSRCAPATTRLRAFPVRLSAMTFRVRLVSATTSAAQLGLGARGSGPRSAPQRLADLEARRQRGDAHLRSAQSGTEELAPPRVPFVEDDDGTRACCHRVCDLRAEEAGTALEEGDRATGEAGEVGRFAAARGRVGPRARDEQVDRDHLGLDPAGARIGERRVVAVGTEAPVGRSGRPQERGRPVDDVRKRELLQADGVSGPAHAGRDVARGSVVAGVPGRTVPAVAIGDSLKRSQVLADGRGGHTRPGLRRLERRPGGRRRCSSDARARAPTTATRRAVRCTHSETFSERVSRACRTSPTRRRVPLRARSTRAPSSPSAGPCPPPSRRRRTPMPPRIRRRATRSARRRRRRRTRCRPTRVVASSPEVRRRLRVDPMRADPHEDVAGQGDEEERPVAEPQQPRVAACEGEWRSRR